MLKVRNHTRDVLIASRVKTPVTFKERSRGLIGVRQLHEQEGMMFWSCRWIHTFFMTTPIDVLFFDRSFKIVKIMHSCKPNRLLPIVLSAAHTLELAPGRLKQTQTKIGDIIECFSFEKREEQDKGAST